MRGPERARAQQLAQEPVLELVPAQALVPLRAWALEEASGQAPAWAALSRLAPGAVVPVHLIWQTP